MERTTKWLRYDFTEAEKKEIAQNMADAVSERDLATDELKSVKKQYDSRISVSEEAIKSNAEKLRSGYETRKIDCTVDKNFDTNEVVVTRVDTGEIVERRTMSAEERQMLMDLEAA